MSKVLKILIILLVVFAIAFPFVNDYIKKYFTDYEGIEIQSIEHQSFIISTGKIKAREDVTIRFEESGDVVKVFKKEGDRVKRGDVILKINSNDLNIEYDRQKSILEREQANLQGKIDGLSETQREKVESETKEKKQNLTNNLRTSIASIQKTSSEIESLVYNSLDPYFNNPNTNPDLKLDVYIPVSMAIGRHREKLGEILDEWRDWQYRIDIETEETIIILNNFIEDLYEIHTAFLGINDELRIEKNFESDYEAIFNEFVIGKNIILDSIVSSVSLLNQLESSIVSYEQALLLQKEAFEGTLSNEKVEQVARVKTEEENLKRINLRLQETEIVSPFDGVIGTISVKENEQVNVGDLAVRIVSEEGYEVDVNITEADVQDVKVGQATKAELDALDKEIDVVVRTVSPAESIVSDVPVYNLIYDVLTEDPLIRPGLSVDVFIPVGEKREVRAVPVSAIRDEGTKKFILISKDSQIKEIEVRVGVGLEDDLVEIKTKDYNIENIDKVLLIKSDK